MAHPTGKHKLMACSVVHPPTAWTNFGCYLINLLFFLPSRISFDHNLGVAHMGGSDGIDLEYAVSCCLVAISFVVHNNVSVMLCLPPGLTQFSLSPPSKPRSLFWPIHPPSSLWPFAPKHCCGHCTTRPASKCGLRQNARFCLSYSSLRCARSVLAYPPARSSGLERMRVPNACIMTTEQSRTPLKMGLLGMITNVSFLISTIIISVQNRFDAFGIDLLPNSLSHVPRVLHVRLLHKQKIQQ